MRCSSLVLALVALAACSRPADSPPPRPTATHPAAAGAVSGGPTVNLPRQAGPWTRPDAPKRVTAETIFDYMDGGGELYLAYRFDRLDVFEYKAADASLGTILVELYWMKTPDDAFGLLSTDWGGEAVELGGPAGAAQPAAPAARALYGAGLLRLCADGLYGRILASRETPSAREQVLAIGRAIMADRKASPAPRIVAVLPPAGPDRYSLRPDRTVFFRSHLVLNSAYFLASQDILGLGPDTDAVTGEYRPPTPRERPLRVILIRYPSPDRARAGLSAFRDAYLPDAAAGGTRAGSGTAHVEHGWVGWALEARDLVLALDAPTSALAGKAAASILGATPPRRSGGK